MFLERHALRLIMREPRRSLAVGAGVILAAALMATVLLFGSASGSTLTRRALADVPVDAQAVSSVGSDPQVAAAQIASDPAVTAALPVDIVHFATAVLDKAGSATQTSVGLLVGIDDNYAQQTGLFTTAEGTRSPGKIAMSRDLATNLGAIPGDSVTFTLPGGRSLKLEVSGIADITGGDLVLGPTDAAHRASGANPPTNVAIIDRASLDQQVLPLVPAGAVAQDPATTGGSGSAPVSTPIAAVDRQVHLRYDLAQVPGDPVAAQTWLDQVRRRIERSAAGAFSIVDDAIAALEPVAGDLLWGQVLFLFLALPGIALAVAVSRLAADATSDATRRHLALLRARGARRSQLARILLEATVGISFVSAIVGAVLGVAVGWLRFGAELASADPVGSTVRAVIVSVAVVTALGAVAAGVVLRDQLREEVATGRQELQRTTPPLWQRLFLDVAALVAAVLVFAITGGTALKPIFTAEGNATVTLALTSFVAPFLFWTGSTLLLLRLAMRWLQRGTGLRRGLERLFGGGGLVAAGSLSARAPAGARAVVVLSLAVSLASSVLIFDATYGAQQVVDAELTLGGDLKVVPSTPTAALPAVQAVSGPEVALATPFVDRIVYVGSEAQDLLGIDPNTLPGVAHLSDSFFDHQSASAAIDVLTSQPDAILVSSETAHDYSIVMGDTLNIRVPDANGNLTVVQFHMAGIALEFPTAPKDAFLVANQSYVAQQTGNDRISFVLARSSGDPVAAAAALQQRVGQDWAVASLATVTARLANGITSVDLAALVQIEVAFAVLIAALGTALFLLASLTERRRELATLKAIGAEPAHMRRAMAAETLVIGLAGTLTGLVVGGLLGFAFLQILAGVFDPPAEFPVVPFLGLAGLIGAVTLALVLATAIANGAVARLQVVAALRER
ncbi:MAG: putative transport system permease protein [Chloroflexota bacterium]|nr:putative transport system permease protein [Chloroflexota bacterium]